MKNGENPLQCIKGVRIRSPRISSHAFIAWHPAARLSLDTRPDWAPMASQPSDKSLEASPMSSRRMPRSRFTVQCSAALHGVRRHAKGHASSNRRDQSSPVAAVPCQTHNSSIAGERSRPNASCTPPRAMLCRMQCCCFRAAHSIMLAQHRSDDSAQHCHGAVVCVWQVR